MGFPAAFKVQNLASFPSMLSSNWVSFAHINPLIEHLCPQLSVHFAKRLSTCAIQHLFPQLNLCFSNITVVSQLSASLMYLLRAVRKF